MCLGHIKVSIRKIIIASKKKKKQEEEEAGTREL
jgi:hypothetical protein